MTPGAPGATDLHWRSATEQAALVRAREVSAVELTEHYLDRISRIDGTLNSFVTVLDGLARDTAAACDARTVRDGEDLPPLHGVPVSFKDLHFMAGTRTTLGTSSYADHVATFDEEVVRRLKAAGVVPLGKTNVSELGSTAHSNTRLLGAARNPWDVERNAAGSSGGAGSSLAAGLCAASQGSDGGGSIRIPAAVNGVVGLKPARDRVSNGPMVGDTAFGLSTRGALTRTVMDAAVLLDVMAGYAAGDPGMAPPPQRPFADEVGAPVGRLRIAVSLQTLVDDGPDPSTRHAVDRTRGILESLGHTTEELALPLPDDLMDRFTDVWCASVASQPFDPSTLEPLNRWLVERARSLSAAALVQSEFRLQLATRQVVGALMPYDALLTPTVTGPALRNDRYDSAGPEEQFLDQAAWVGVTPLANLTGLPAISLPLVADDTTGLPVGVQLFGRPWDEAGLLRLAAQLEQAQPWRHRHPPLATTGRA